MPNKWFKIQAKADKKAEVFIFDEIGNDWYGDGVSAKGFIKEIKALGAVDEITVMINSPGGAVFDGNAIYNALKSHKAKIIVRIEGLAASIASVIAMAGDEIIMPANAMMMIHNPRSYAGGTAEDLRKSADALDMIKGSMLTTYAGKTGQTVEKISELMDEETWMDATTAKQLGFADTVEEAVKIAAHFDLSRYEKVPSALSIRAVVAHQPANQEGNVPTIDQNGTDPTDGKTPEAQTNEEKAQIAEMTAKAGMPELAAQAIREEMPIALVKERIASVLEIRAMCKNLNRPEMAAGLSVLTIDQAKARLFDVMAAEGDAAKINSSIVPDGAGGKPVHDMSTTAVYARINSQAAKSK